MILPRRLSLLLLCSFGFAQQSFSQSTLASLSGSVHDSSGALVAGANVTVTRAEDQSHRTTAANNAGNFTVVNLSPGTYAVRITAPTFTPLEQTGFLLAARQNLRLDLTLTTKASADVTVNAESAGAIDTADAQISA